jgi:spermidine synthase
MDELLKGMRRTGAIPLLSLLFFFSGATSLVYQTIWARELHLVFGTSSYAIATVLAAFMGGLALGGFWMARHADRLSKPLLTYGLLEFGIGLYALIFPWLLHLVKPLYLGFYRVASPTPLVFGLFQFLLLSLLLLIPTTCMGATLPLLTRFVSERTGAIGGRVGMLYGINTLGAVLGVGLAGFYLLPGLGLAKTLYLAAAGNFILGVCAWLLSRHVAEGGEPPAVLEEEESSGALAIGIKPLLWIAAFSGCAALIYELAWFRLLTLILGASTYAFSTMLLAFLIGIALGGWAGGPLSDRIRGRKGARGVLFSIGLVQVGIGLLSFLMMLLYQELPVLYLRLYDANADNLGLGWGRQIWLAIILMTPPALLMGATFSLLVRAGVGSASGVLGAHVGRVYGANTLGSLFGAVAAGFFLLPSLNVIGAVKIAILVNLAAALVAFSRVFETAFSRIKMSVAAFFCVLGVWHSSPPWDPAFMTAGVYKYIQDLDSPTRQNLWDYAVRDYDLLYYKEGRTTVVTVAQSKHSGNIWMANNGKVEASTTVDMPTQVLVSHLPFLFLENPKKAVVIGLASGITAGAVSLHRELSSIEVVELEPAIIKASRFFDDFNHRPLEDPRVELVLNDGRNHILLGEKEQWDLVVAEPSNPWITGVSNLFTLEFWEMGKSRLTEGGVWSQWVQLYGMAPDDLLSLLATFREVFPHVRIFATIEDSDLVMLGSKQPLDFDMKKASALFSTSELKTEFKEIDVRNPYDLLVFYRMDQDGVAKVVGDIEFNTDDNMRVEYSAPKQLYKSTGQANIRTLMKSPQVPELSTIRQSLDMAGAYGDVEDWVRGMIVLKRLLQENPKHVEASLLWRYYMAQFEKSQNQVHDSLKAE